MASRTSMACLTTTIISYIVVHSLFLLCLHSFVFVGLSDQIIRSTAKESWISEVASLAILFNPQRYLKQYPQMLTDRLPGYALEKGAGTRSPEVMINSC